MSKFSIRKYNGDDDFSWAVFRTKDVKGLGRQIFSEDAQPIICGCAKEDAQSYKLGFERKFKNNQLIE